MIVRTTVELGHGLGLRVTAEGVEDGDTLAAAVAIGCDAAQGFHMARPMPAAEIDRWLEESPFGARAIAV